MKRILLNLIGLFISLNVIAQTNVSGNINANTTWTKANSPYILQGDVSLGTSVTLTIEPGVTVKSSGRYHISISNASASLVAQGTASDSVRFEAPEQENAFVQFSNANTSLSRFKFLSVVGQGNTNYENEFVSVQEISSEGVLEVVNSKFVNTALYLKENGRIIKIENSEILNTYLWTNAGNSGFILNNDLLVYSNISTHWQDTQGKSDMGVTNIDNCEFLNSPIYATHTSLIVSNSRFFSDNSNLRASPSSGVGHFITTSELIMDNCLFDGYDQQYGFQLTDVTKGQSHNNIRNSIFYRCLSTAYIGRSGTSTFSQNDIIKIRNGHNFVISEYGTEIDARDNYYDGIVDLDSLEKRIRHLPDGGTGDRVGGLVDFSSPRSSVSNEGFLPSPDFSISRNFVADTHQNDVTLSMETGRVADFSTFEVYRPLSKEAPGLILLGTYSSSSDAVLPYQEGFEYYLKATKSDGSKSMFSKAFNNRPLIYEGVYDSEAEAGSEIKVRYKVIDQDKDLVKFTIKSNESSSFYIQPENLGFEQVGTSGDTLLYDLTINLAEDKIGFVYVEVSYSDGLHESSSGVVVKVISKPILEGVDLIKGHYEGFAFNVNEPDLFPFITKSGQDNDPIRIKITEVLNGTLIQNGDTVQSLDYIPGYTGSEELLWYAPTGAGITNAFRIRLYDNDAESDNEATVQFDLLENTAPEITLIDTLTATEDQLRYLFFDSHIESFTDFVASADIDEHEVYYKITELQNGQLLESNAEDSKDLLLPSYFRDTQGQGIVFWQPPTNQFGKIAGFKIKATDGAEESTDEYQVFFNVQAVNDPPTFDYVRDPEPVLPNGETKTITITGVSDGVNENENLSFNLTSSNEAIVSNENLSISYSTGDDQAVLMYTGASGSSGTSIISINLSDGVMSYTQDVQVTFLPESIGPEINVSDNIIAYTDYPFNLDFTITDNQEYFSASGESDASWLEIDNRQRVKRLTSFKNYYSESKTGLLTEAMINAAYSMVKDKQGNIWLALNRTIKLISPNGVVSTVVGNGEGGDRDGQGKDARISVVTHLAYNETEDAIYFIDNHKVVKRVDSEYNVSTVFKSDQPLDVHGNFGPLDFNSSGDILLANSYSYGNNANILKINKEGGWSVYAGAPNPHNSPSEGQKDGISIFDVDALKVIGDQVYFTGGGLFRKINSEGISQTIDLEDGLSNAGYDSYLEVYDDDHLLVFQKNVEKIVKVNLTDYSIEYLTGELAEYGQFQDNMLSSDFITGNGSGVHFSSMISLADHVLLLALSQNNDAFYAIVRDDLDSIKGTAKIDDIGEYQVELKATDFEGNISQKTVTVEVRANNKIETTNINQTISFDEDIPTVDLTDIAISGLSSSDEAKVTITIDPSTRARFSVDSGNGETFDAVTGIWTITGNQELVNSALAYLKLIPGKDYDQNFAAKVTIVNAAGGVPNIGEVNFIVNPIADLPMLSTMLTDSAYAEIPYSFDFDVKDPDSYLFNFDIDDFPSWLSYQEGELWVENYVGLDDRNGFTVDGDLKSAKFDEPRKIYIGNSNDLYVLERNKVRRILSSGVVSTLSYNQEGLSEPMPLPYAVAMAIHNSGELFFADSRRITKLSVNGDYTEVAGNYSGDHVDGAALDARFQNISALVFNDQGDLFIADNYRIRKLDTDGNVTTIAGSGGYGFGSGDALTVPFYTLKDLEIDNDGNLLIVDERSVRRLNLSNSQIEIVIGKDNNSCCNLGDANSEVYFRDLNDISLDENGNIYGVTDDWFFFVDLTKGVTRTINTYNYPGEKTGNIDMVGFNDLISIAIVGDNYFVVDRYNNIIKRIYQRPGTLSGTPTLDDIGINRVAYTLTDENQQEHSFSAQIDVRANDMPVIDGLDLVFSGVENDPSIDVSGLSISNAENDLIHVSFVISNENSGRFSESSELGASYNESSKRWEMRTTQISANEFLNSLEFYPEEEFFGRVKVKVEARKIGGIFTREGSFIIDIQRSNSSPEFIDFSTMDAMVDLEIDMSLPIIDVDEDPVYLSVDGLPDWLTLERNVDFMAGTVADFKRPTNFSDLPIDGLENIATSFGTYWTSYDGQGNWYFVEGQTLRKFDGEILETILDLKFSNPYALYNFAVTTAFDGVFVYNSERIFKLVDGELELVVGAVSNQYPIQDIDGSREEVRFGGLIEIVSDGQGGFYLADISQKIKYLDADGKVTTVAGTGEYGSSDGSALESTFDRIRRIDINEQGELLILDNGGSRVRKLSNGVVSTLFPTDLTTNYISRADYFHSDIFGVTYLFKDRRIDVYDADGSLWRTLSVDYESRNGDGNSMGWASFYGLEPSFPGTLYFADYTNSDLRSLTYSYSYKLVGTPPVGSEGNQILTFTLQDGVGDDVVYQIPLTVASPDRPEITGFPQEFDFVEDDPAFGLNPIGITTDDTEELFEVLMAPMSENIGDLTTPVLELSDSLKNGVYRLSGNANKLNEILGSLSFQPGLNSDTDGKLAFSFKRLGGNLEATGIIELNVTPVNDFPEIINLKDTTAFVGDSLTILFDAFDVEDGSNPNITLTEKPDWLNYTLAKAEDELLAGKPGKSGFSFGSALNSELATPFEVVKDPSDNLVFVSLGTHSISSLSPDGQLTNIAGDGRSGYIDGTTSEARFSRPSRILSLKDGSFIVGDLDNKAIRVIKDGMVSTLIGPDQGLSLEGMGLVPGPNSNPLSIGMTSNEKTLVVAQGNQVRLVDMESMVYSSLEVSPYIYGFPVTTLSVTNNDELLISSRYVLHRFDLSGKLLKQYGGGYGYGDGPANQAYFTTVAGAVEDPFGNIYVIDRWNYVIRKIDKNDNVSTVAGRSGQGGCQSGFNDQIKINTEGNLLWDNGSLIFADNYNHVIRRIRLDQEILSGRPKTSDLGEAQVKVVVQDGQDAVSTTDFTINVLENDRPNVSGLDTTIFIGEKDEFARLPKVQIQESDTESIELRIESNGSAEYQLGSSETHLLSFNEEEEAWLLSGTVAELNAVLDDLNLYASSFINEKLTFSFKKVDGNLSKVGTIQIFAEPENDAPILSNALVYDAVVGETFELTFEAMDEDSDVLSFSSEVLPSWLSGDSIRLIQEYYNPIYSDELPDSIKEMHRFVVPGLAQNSNGQVYMTSLESNQIFELMPNGTRKFFTGSGVQGYLDGNAQEAQFLGMESILFDSNDHLLVGENTNMSLRSVDPDGNVITRMGNGRQDLSTFQLKSGQGSDASPGFFKDIDIDNEGNVYSAEFYSIGKTDMNDYYTSIAGKYPELLDIDGNRDQARFRNIQAIVALDVDSLLVWELWTFKLKRYANNKVETIAGGTLGYEDGSIRNAKFGQVSRSIQLGSGEILFADRTNSALRIMDFEEDSVFTIAGKGYLGNDFGDASESAIGRVASLLELHNGDILFGEIGQVKRLAYSMPKITGTPQLSDIGEHKFTLRISDGKDGIIEEEITINVVAPNSAPTVSEITDVEEVYLPESKAELSLFEYFEDAENIDSELIYEVIANSDPTVINPQTISSEDGLLILEVLNAGETELSIKATDEGGLSVSTTFKVAISQADALIKVTYDEGIEEDGTDKSVTVTTEPADLLFNITYNGLTELPVEAGTYEVVVSINERNYKGTNTSEFVLLTANNAPTASEIPDILDTYATELTKELSLYEFFEDAEQEDSELTYEVTANSDPTVINPRVVNSENGLLILDVLNAGETELSIKATDERGLSASTTFKVIIGQADALIEVSYDNTIEEDGTGKSVTVTTEPADLLFDVTYDGSADLPISAGTYEVVVTINEGNYKGVSTSEFILLTANTSPKASEVLDITDIYAPELRKELSVYDYFEDAEQSDDELIYELVSISDETIVSSASEINPDTGVLSLIVKNAGTATIILKVTDERGLSVTNSFDITIGKAKATISFGTLDFVNDGEDKPVSITTVPEGLSFDLTYNEMSTVPNTVGVYDLKVVIDDPNYEGEATATLNITNIAPSKISVSNRAVYENIGASVTIGELSVTDENGVDTHTFSLVDGEGDNDSFEISGNELLAKSSFDYESKDSYNIKIKVTDNHGGTYEETFQIDVLDVNESPTIDQVDKVQIVKNLGVLSLDLSGLSAGEDSGQNILISTTSSGVVASSSVVLNSDGRSASLSFETTVDQEGNGIITVIVKDDGGTDNNGVDTKTIEISVLVADPNISVVSGSSCGEGSLSLSASGADNYFWYNSPIGGESFDQGAEITVSLSESTTYYVAGVFGNEESELRVPINASVFEAVEVPIITNTDNVLSVPQIAGLNYQWFKDGVEIADETSNTYNAEESGSYFVMATNENGCFANSISIDLIITSLEKELDEVNLIAYPVPASDFITLEFEELFKKGTTIKLIGSTGRVFSTNTLKSSTSSVRIDVRGLPSGTHTVLVRDGGKFARKRIIIKR